MSSAVYFKFKASLKQYTIPFEGSAISVKDLRNAIRLSCGLKSTDFELQILDKQGKEFAKEEDLIPKFSDLIVRRLPKASDAPKKKIANPEDMTRRDPYKAMNALSKVNLYSNSINLAKANIPDDEKLDIMTKRCSEEYSEKNYLVKPKPYGVPPASYVCNKCHQGGHWIHECPGLRDREGKLLDFKSVKRPTGIPQDFLLEVAPGTPGAYLTKEGKYMVPIKDAEAYALGKKEKRPFSVEENPPYIVKDEELPSKLKCLLCSKLLENPTCTPCCSSVFCIKCITDYLYDPEVNGSRQCPSCLTIIENHESLVDNELLRQLIQCWKANMLTKEIVDSFLLSTTNYRSSSSTSSTVTNKKTELNEDSSKSPEMKFNSANDDGVENGSTTNTVTIKTEKEKVFVNNRRVLKPKVLPAKSDVKAEDQDVNDFIFEKLQDSDLTPEAVAQIEPAVSTVGRNDHNLKIETIAKRVDNAPKNIDRKPLDSKYRSKNDMVNQPQHHSFDPSTQLINSHFPVSASSSSAVTAQMVNSIHPQLMESLPWPLVNPLYGAINPLQTMFGAALNSVTAVGAANWLNNGLNLPSVLPINSNNNNVRILTKEEFYERQRRLRAEKSKRRYREDNAGTSRSPSGSQSPRRGHRSKYDHTHKVDDNSTKSHYHSKSKDTIAHSTDVVKKSRSSHHRDAVKSSDNNSHKVDHIAKSSDIKAIDPKLMQDSIKTFLKYLSANPASEDVHESVQCKKEKVTTSNNHKHASSTTATTTTSTSVHVADKKSTDRRGSARSRSVPKVSKDRLMTLEGHGREHERMVSSRSTAQHSKRSKPVVTTDNPGGDGGSKSTKTRASDGARKRKSDVTKHSEDINCNTEKVRKKRVSDNVAESGAAVAEGVAVSGHTKRAKKSKHRHHHNEPRKDHDNDDKKKHKHKKRKHKKAAHKSKKNRRDS